jgi:putative ABC transport system permease protein
MSQNAVTAAEPVQRRRPLDLGPELQQGFDNLRAHKMRSALTMLGMIFGVAAVIAMLSIGAGAQQEVIAFIEQLGVRNVIIEAREAADAQTLQRVRQISQGLSFSDYRGILATLKGVGLSTPRKRVVPSQVLPKPQAEPPAVFGVEPSYQTIANLRTVSGRFFTDEENVNATPVAVLGQAAAASLFGADNPVDKHVKLNDQWFQIIGIAGPQMAARQEVEGVPAIDRNNLVYVPLMAAMLRLEESQSRQRDEIDGIYLGLTESADVSGSGAIIRGLLDATHRGAGDFSVIVPAELLAEQQRTRRLFEIVMVSIAAISLLVGGIGIMNIMLASVMERTKEIGVRRAIGATRRDIIRQFLVETTLITLTGGLAGVIVGIALSQLVAYAAGWSTIISPISVILSCAVSVSVGIVFGLYPAMRAAKLDPVHSLHYE